MTAATIAIAIQGLTIIALVVLLVIRERDHDKAVVAAAEHHRADREQADERAQTERRELANRIQHPALLPVQRKPGEGPARAPKDVAAYATVGRPRPPQDGPQPSSEN